MDGDVARIRNNKTTQKFWSENLEGKRPQNLKNVPEDSRYKFF